MAQLPHFRERLLRGDLLVGTMITLNAPAVAELMAGIGFDWLFIDAEHGVFEARDLQALLQAAGTTTPGIVRLATLGEAPIKKALDVGAAGIIAPMVNTAAQAAEVVRLAKYAPAGERGVGIARAHGYGLRLAEYVGSANERVAVIVQAEHIEAVRNIEAIVRVPGIDAVLVGPYDLSASLGKLGQVDDPEVRQAIDRVTAACRNAGVQLGIFGVSAAAVKPYIDQGYTLIVAGVDTILLGQAAQGLLTDLKA
jgi:2-keto-3-deoxy-L-rhamnonate aldolase RhmA